METNKEIESAKTLGIVSLVCAFLCWPAGIICGHISLGKYKKAGVSTGTGLAKAGLIISYIFAAFFVLSMIGCAVAAGAAASSPELQEALQNMEVE